MFTYLMKLLEPLILRKKAIDNRAEAIREMKKRASRYKRGDFGSSVNSSSSSDGSIFPAGLFIDSSSHYPSHCDVSSVSHCDAGSSHCDSGSSCSTDSFCG